jgi:hypothetical protein
VAAFSRVQYAVNMKRRSVRTIAIVLVGSLLLAGMVLPAWSQAAPVLRTEFQDTQPKFIKNPDSSFGGLCLELMAILEKKAGIRISYPNLFVPISRITQDLAAGNIDIYFGLEPLAKVRQKAIRFVGVQK